MRSLLSDTCSLACQKTGLENDVFWRQDLEDISIEFENISFVELCLYKTTWAALCYKQYIIR